MKTIITSLDFDGIFLDLQHLSIAHILKTKNITVKPEDITFWEFYAEHHPEIFKAWKDWDIYSSAPIIAGSVDFYNKLVKRYGKDSIQIVTHTIGEYEVKKDEFIENLLGIDRELIVHASADDKAIYTEGTILLDDYHETVLKHTQVNQNAGIIFSDGYHYNLTPYEKQHDLVHRATSFDEAYSIITNIHN